MDLSAGRTDSSKRWKAYSAAAMYGAASLIDVIEGLIHDGPNFSLLPGFGAVAVVIALLLLGPRLPNAVLALLGPLGAALIAYALATTDGPGDGAILYVWPVLWMSHFYGRAGSAAIVAWIGVVHAIALSTLPPNVGYPDRWVDVMVSVSVVAVVVETLSERNRRLVRRLSHEARNDTLTGVLNRRGFEERLELEIERAEREGTAIGVVSFDIDHFKAINDQRGHDAGDRVLAHLGAVLRAQTRAVDVKARMGGEEFVVLLPGSDLEQTRECAERVRSAFAAPADPELPRTTLSAGVTAAIAPDDAKALLQAADSALYDAKRGGRNRAIVRPERAYRVVRTERHVSLQTVAG